MFRLLRVAGWVVFFDGGLSEGVLLWPSVCSGG